jgi:hypothetical protein
VPQEATVRTAARHSWVGTVSESQPTTTGTPHVSCSRQHTSQLPQLLMNTSSTPACRCRRPLPWKHFTSSSSLMVVLPVAVRPNTNFPSGQAHNSTAWEEEGWLVGE